MLKKLLFCSIILIISVLLLNATYATDIVNTTNTITGPLVMESPVDDTIYSSDNSISDTTLDTTPEYEESNTTTTVTTTDYDNSTELSISNIINIILIAVGIVLVFLGIAIIIKLK